MIKTKLKRILASLWRPTSWTRWLSRRRKRREKMNSMRRRKRKRT